jgi:hypothetical protein
LAGLYLRRARGTIESSGVEKRRREKVEVLPNILCRFNSHNRIWFLFAIFTVLMIPSFSSAQELATPPDNQETSKHILGIIPTYPTSPSLRNDQPLMLHPIKVILRSRLSLQAKVSSQTRILHSGKE